MTPGSRSSPRFRLPKRGAHQGKRHRNGPTRQAVRPEADARIRTVRTHFAPDAFAAQRGSRSVNRPLYTPLYGGQCARARPSNAITARQEKYRRLLPVGNTLWICWQACATIALRLTFSPGIQGDLSRGGEERTPIMLEAISIPLCGLADHDVSPSGRRPHPVQINQPVTSAKEMMQGDVNPAVGRTLMPGRNISLGWPAAIGGLSLLACSGMAMAQGAPPPPAVSVTPVASRQVTETSEFVGRVTAINKVDIVARVPGFIEQRLFTEGQLVKNGDLLFRHRAGHLQGGGRAAARQSRQGQGHRGQRRAAIGARQGAACAIRTSRRPRVDQRAADEAAAQADILEAQAALDQAQINLGYTDIRSPIDGRIGRAAFTVGNLVSPASGSWRRSSARTRST